MAGILPVRRIYAVKSHFPVLPEDGSPLGLFGTYPTEVTPDGSIHPDTLYLSVVSVPMGFDAFTTMDTLAGYRCMAAQDLGYVLEVS